MDWNVVILNGALAASPELRTFESGTQLLRLLVTVRTPAPRRRIDVVPVTWWEPADTFVDSKPAPGRRLWVFGTVQRRFWSATEGRRSRVEIVASEVSFEDETPGDGGG